MNEKGRIKEFYGGKDKVLMEWLSCKRANMFGSKEKHTVNSKQKEKWRSNGKKKNYKKFFYLPLKEYLFLFASVTVTTSPSPGIQQLSPQYPPSVPTASHVGRLTDTSMSGRVTSLSHEASPLKVKGVSQAIVAFV